MLFFLLLLWWVFLYPDWYDWDELSPSSHSASLPVPIPTVPPAARVSLPSARFPQTRAANALLRSSPTIACFSPLVSPSFFLPSLIPLGTGQRPSTLVRVPHTPEPGPRGNGSPKHSRGTQKQRMGYHTRRE